MQTKIWFGLACWMGGMLLLGACSSKPGSEEEPLREVETKINLAKAPKAQADSAYAFVKAQVDFGPRVPNTEAHQRTGDFLVAQLKKMGWDVSTQSFEAKAYNGTLLRSRNIIASLNPKATTRLLLAAHWDTRPFNDKEAKDSLNFVPIDGANDGASGVGVLLEVARVMGQSAEKPALGLDIILFDSEDYGQPENYAGQWSPDLWCLGSQYWAKNPHREGYSAYFGILLDMVGAKNAQFYREGYSMQYAPSVTKKVWQIAQQLGFGKYFIARDSPTIIDDHYYVNTLAKIPMLNIVDYDPQNAESFFPPYHHTRNDNMKIIDKNTLQAVAQTVLQVIYQENAELTNAE